MKPWVGKAVELLAASLGPPRHELNELDWKLGPSPDKRRLTEHLSAFANHPGGGFLVFGVDSGGQPTGFDQDDVDTAVGQIANLGRQALEPPFAVDHAVERYQDVPLLFVSIPESAVKPVRLRGKDMEHSFVRSGGTTRRASPQELGNLLLHSRIPRWEELRASSLLADGDLVTSLELQPILTMLQRPAPTQETEWLAWLEGERFICREPNGGGFVTNLGGIAAARQLADFPDLVRKAVRVVVYDGLNKSKARDERLGIRGYAVGFRGLLGHLAGILPRHEVLENGLRQVKTLYPETALRELVANALIHQDFAVMGAGPLIEVFDDRIEISNPGSLLPSKQLDRLIGTQPESRNERLASAFRRFKICEERGSGLVKACLEVELSGLPPIQFESGENHFKVTLSAPRTYAQMSSSERLQACYQHAVLKHLSSSVLTNTSLRERLKMPETQRSMVSALIQEAVDKQLIRRADPTSTSRKFADYVPYWA